MKINRIFLIENIFNDIINAANKFLIGLGKCNRGCDVEVR